VLIKISCGFLPFKMTSLQFLLPKYLQSLQRLEVDTSTVDLSPVIDHLVHFTNQYYNSKMQQCVNDFQQLTKTTYHKLILSTDTSTTNAIRELLKSSLDNFTNYIKFKYQCTHPTPLVVVNDESTLSTFVSSDAVLAQLLISLMNYHQFVTTIPRGLIREIGDLKKTD